MKKQLVIIIFVFSVFSWIFLPFPIHGKGVYNNVSGLIWCQTETICIHEVGHKLDDEAGWVSHSKDFSLTVSAFVWFELDGDKEPNPFVYKIMALPGVFTYSPPWIDANAELYASLFQWAEGKEKNMPEALRPFYDWERAQELIEKVMR